jgi:nucleoside-diphosphate-sugar epimerase
VESAGGYGTAVILGTTERTRVIDAVHEVIRIANYSPRIELLPHMPTGPLNRVASNNLAKRLLGWEPQVAFMDGLAQTFQWYASIHDPTVVRAIGGARCSSTCQVQM